MGQVKVLDGCFCYETFVRLDCWPALRHSYAGKTQKTLVQTPILIKTIKNTKRENLKNNIFNQKPAGKTSQTTNKPIFEPYKTKKA